MSSSVHKSLESPIDYNRTDIKKMPLSADSIKMDAQYFQFDENKQEASNTVSAIKSYVEDSSEWLGIDISGDVGNSVAKQVSSQIESHDIQGTLVLTASCTHKDAAVLAPFVIDVDKAIRIWNTMFTNASDKIKLGDPAAIATIAAMQGTTQEKSFEIISGATYGSSFVGMVHVLKDEKTNTSQRMESIADSIQGQMDMGAWFEKEAGGFGVNKSVSDDVKSLLSNAQIQSHISVVTMGVIPSIKSNQLGASVKSLTMDPKAMMDSLAQLANATEADITSVASAATAARTGGQLQAMATNQITGVLTALAPIDEAANKVLDINSMMTAFEDYIDKCIAGQVGVPINYYTKPITRTQLAQMWVAKYYPNKYLSISGDDSKTAVGDSTTQPPAQ
jgi:hypothetical protein